MTGDVRRSVPLSAPLYDASPAQAFRRFWLKYANFSGRAGTGRVLVVGAHLDDRGAGPRDCAVRPIGASLQTYLAHPVYELRWSLP